jgi:bifunctional NMN adenylyltransferase/nudix hydrolase
MNVGIVVARFQIDELHKGHCHVIEYTNNRCDLTVVVLGARETRLADDNPLPFNIRKGMVKARYPFADVVSLSDVGDDDWWSKRLDELIHKLYSAHSIRLYCSRDGFKKSYTGVYEVIEIDSVEEKSATDRRKEIFDTFDPDSPIQNSVPFRRGMIYASQFVWPTSYQTTDIVALKWDYKIGDRVLLGKRKSESFYRLFGGFVDPKDPSLEVAAGRELEEEANISNHHGLQYVCSQRIDDWRYRKSKHKIMTSLFVTYIMSGEPKAGDDIDEVEWFTWEEAEKVIAPYHRELLLKAKTFINKKQETYY